MLHKVWIVSYVGNLIIRLEYDEPVDQLTAMLDFKKTYGSYSGYSFTPGD